MNLNPPPRIQKIIALFQVGSDTAADEAVQMAKDHNLAAAFEEYLADLKAFFVKYWDIRKRRKRKSSGRRTRVTIARSLVLDGKIRQSKRFLSSFRERWKMIFGVKELRLKKEITSIPQKIGLLSKLKNIGFEHSKVTAAVHIEALPKGITACKHIEELDLSGCFLITSLPKGFFTAFPKLKVLRASRTFVELNILAHASDFVQIEKLYLKGIRVRNYDKKPLLLENIKYLKNLSVLNLEGNWKGLAAFPEAVTSLKQLEVLSLDKCGLKEIPPSIGKMTNLRSLFLRDNHLLSFPDALLQLKKLKEIHLGSNAGSYRGLLGRINALLFGETHLKEDNLPAVLHRLRDNGVEVNLARYRSRYYR